MFGETKSLADPSISGQGVKTQRDSVMYDVPSIAASAGPSPVRLCSAPVPKQNSKT